MDIPDIDRDSTTELLLRNIETLMRARGLTAVGVAKQGGMNPTAVRDILMGKSRSPTVSTIGKIAGALGVRPADLFAEEPEALLTASTPSAFRELQVLFEGLPRDRQALLLATIRAWSLPPRQQDPEMDDILGRISTEDRETLLRVARAMKPR